MLFHFCFLLIPDAFIFYSFNCVFLIGRLNLLFIGSFLFYRSLFGWGLCISVTKSVFIDMSHRIIYLSEDFWLLFIPIPHDINPSFSFKLSIFFKSIMSFLIMLPGDLPTFACKRLYNLASCAHFFQLFLSPSNL